MSDNFQDVYDPSFTLPGTEGDNALHVEFFTSPVDELEYVRIYIPGDAKLQPVYPADDEYDYGLTYKMRFHAQYEAFKSGREQHAGQKFLDQVAWITTALKQQLNMLGIFTLEGLANVPDGNLEKLPMGGRNMRKKAQDELAQEARAKDAEKSEQTIAKLQAQIDSLKAAVGKKPVEAKAAA